jgi:hypothetical protein
MNLKEIVFKEWGVNPQLCRNCNLAKLHSERVKQVKEPEN